jgi:hypothetical protein
MTPIAADLPDRLQQAVKHFWIVRSTQQKKQGGGEEKDRGERSAVTGGKHVDGFIRLVRSLLLEAGLTNTHVFCKPREEGAPPPPKRKKGKKRDEAFGVQPTRTVLPGWFRAEKDWDFVVIVNGLLVAGIEFKSHVGSFGNNCNNRAEEALGNATDLLAAFREGAFQPSVRPWLGYLMLLEEAEKSTRPVRVVEPHFKVFEEFRNASYADRYNILLKKLVRERLYDGACFLMSKKEDGLAAGTYTEPNPELNFRNFMASLLGHALGIAALQPPAPAPGRAKKPSKGGKDPA